jgi:hypothetical protein
VALVRRPTSCVPPQAWRSIRFVDSSGATLQLVQKFLGRKLGLPRDAAPSTSCPWLCHHYVTAASAKGRKAAGSRAAVTRAPESLGSLGIRRIGREGRQNGRRDADRLVPLLETELRRFLEVRQSLLDGAALADAADLRALRNVKVAFTLNHRTQRQHRHRTLPLRAAELSCRARVSCAVALTQSQKMRNVPLGPRIGSA